MAIDRVHLGYALPVFTVEVSAQRVADFRCAIGDTAAGDRAFVAPPTFMKVVEGEDNSSRRILEALAVDLRRVLHAEQQFEYFAPICAGDVLEVERKVTELYDKKGGSMEFIVVESLIRKASGERVGTSRQVVVVRHPAARA